MQQNQKCFLNGLPNMPHNSRKKCDIEACAQQLSLA